MILMSVLVFVLRKKQGALINIAVFTDSHVPDRYSSQSIGFQHLIDAFLAQQGLPFVSLIYIARRKFTLLRLSEPKH